MTYFAPSVRRDFVMPRLAYFLSAALTLLCAGGAHSDEPASRVIAALDMDLIDTSVGADTRGNAKERQRLRHVAELIRERLDAEPRFSVVDAERTRAAVADADPGQYLHACNGCELDLGRTLGADWVLVGWAQKVSDLILNLNVVVRDVGTGEKVATAFVDLRGNSDATWLAATEYLLNKLLLRKLRKKS